MYKINNNVFFVLFIIINLLSSTNVIAKDKFYDYKWTEKHPILSDYILNYKDRILEYTPYKIKNSKKYIDFIEASLAKEGVPREVVVLAAIESGFDPNARSQTSAIGMWQFTTATAKDWGLVVNSNVDERKDWRKSTIAASKYLKWMAEKHFNGNYETAILAYNTGIGNVKKAMKEFDTTDPWEIIKYDYLPKENREFLPKYITFMHYFYYLKNNNL
jgi:membrane-bound lytic murein transglycosylase D